MIRGKLAIIIVTAVIIVVIRMARLVKQARSKITVKAHACTNVAWVLTLAFAQADHLYCQQKLQNRVRADGL
jgi:hypothetical protein